MVPSDPRIETTVAPDASIAGQKPETENFGANEIVAADLTAAQVGELKKAGVVTGGMIPKVNACLDALARGARSARSASLKDFLAGGAPSGTRIVEA